MDLKGLDESNPEHIIAVLKGLTKIIKEENEIDTEKQGY